MISYILSNGESYFWSKLRTKGEWEIEKGKRSQWPAAKRSGVSRWVSSLGYPFQGSSDRNTFPIASLWFSLASPQIPYSLLLLTVLLTLIGVPFDQTGCCTAGWFLSLYMHVIRSLNTNQKPQAKKRKKEEKERWISHQRQLLPLITCCGNSVFARLMSWE